MSNLLDVIEKENDIKKIDPSLYNELSKEMRRFIVKSVAQTGGHLASSLGAVDLTIALHSQMDLPKDKIIWDVGHQSYAHKILTGRKKEFDSLREMGGLSGFPKRHESETDSFDTGHSSTSISAALGMAQAAKLNGSDEKIVAVIGDGALTGGMALEALNNVESLKRNFVIILNDNTMSISKNVGGMSKYLNNFRIGTGYNDFKEDLEQSLEKIPRIGSRLAKKLKRTKDNMKNILIPGNGFFDDLGITYIGPVDGHNIKQMTKILNAAYKINHPILIHVKTKKGHGYVPAMKKPELYHGVGPFNYRKGVQVSSNGEPSYTDVFSEKIVELAAHDEDIVAITAAMPDGTGLTNFAKNYPDRFFDVGIAEEHAVTFAAGLACEGKKPFVSIYSSFYQRAYDQILHDVCLQNLPVKFMVDRAGIVGKDGETHQGLFDISFLSAMPNMTIIAPNSDTELKAAIDFAKDFDGPIAVRYARGKAYHTNETPDFSLGKSYITKKGDDICIIAVGNIYEEAERATKLLAEDNIDATLVNARFIKPIDEKLIGKLFKKYDHIIVLEEGIKKGGYGESIEVFAEESDEKVNIHVMAIEDEFVQQGSVNELRDYLGISAESVVDRVKSIL
ncbi:MAG: 1-deoxy-D-xylulose-5-phosphate synthase [Eubacterium sp.]|nr:1-deoxy-D-xylulose-5-phosphate synthase [Eubacterium sp.]